MHRLWLVVVLLLLAVGAAGAAYRPDPAISGTLTQSATRAVPGETLTFTARAVDEDTLYDIAGLPVSTIREAVRYSWSVTAGTIVSRSAPDQTPNRLSWRAPLAVGQYAITVQADDVSTRSGTDDPPWQAVAVVRVGSGLPGPEPPGVPAGLAVRVDPDRLPADGTSTAQVYATLTQPREAGHLVRFTATSGTITAQAATDARGVARATLRAPSTASLATVVATTDKLVAQALVEYVPQVRRYPYFPVPVPVLRGQVLVTASPSSVPADGMSSTQINVMVLEPLGRAVALLPVWLASTNGAISGYGATDLYGRATAYLRAAPSPGTAVVTAWTSLGAGQTTVQFNPIMIKLTASQDEAPADGKTVVRLVARVTDTAGSPVADSTPVSFSSGTGPEAQVATVAGIAAAQITAPDQPEKSVVTARALGVSDQVTVNFTAPPSPPPPSPGAATIRLGANPNVLPADGKATARITVLLLGADDQPLAGKEVQLTTTAGRIETKVTTDKAGRAEATLRAPDQPAEALVTAEYEHTVAALTVRFK